MRTTRRKKKSNRKSRAKFLRAARSASPSSVALASNTGSYSPSMMNDMAVISETLQVTRIYPTMKRQTIAKQANRLPEYDY